MLSNVKLFPTLIIVSLIALVLKVSSVWTGVELMNAPVVAQENQEEDKPEKKDDKPAADKKDDNQPADLDDIVNGDDLSSTEEDNILQKLRQRSAQIDQRERSIDLKEKLLLKVEQDIDFKIKDLERIRGEIKILLGEFEKHEKDKLNKLVAMYSNMNPKRAAPIFVELKQKDLATLLKVASNMPEKKFSKILELMPALQASELTTSMAEMAKPDASIALQ
ncbi:hypothetical protein QGN29_08935 [Temperatibacter marinus]|uniref:Magnesium transporter MgtE intracellular domain-containing protein n=1 Tax=Temperatibacter marinus TaxID=1456591 RepID=A0AA52EEM8_9PROT|nr:hypothetical protein [Temperatibacter marinus]WND01683.1 hypothetical protein QGN29_08935 [Temperatibacter marinus]